MTDIKIKCPVHGLDMIVQSLDVEYHPYTFSPNDCCIRLVCLHGCRMDFQSDYKKLKNINNDTTRIEKLETFLKDFDSLLNHPNSL